MRGAGWLGWANLALPHVSARGWVAGLGKPGLAKRLRERVGGRSGQTWPCRTSALEAERPRPSATPTNNKLPRQSAAAAICHQLRPWVNFRQ
eukprot:355983-Chlamydomonas_euryale.AAC.9